MNPESRAMIQPLTACGAVRCGANVQPGCHKCPRSVGKRNNVSCDETATRKHKEPSLALALALSSDATCEDPRIAPVVLDLHLDQDARPTTATACLGCCSLRVFREIFKLLHTPARRSCDYDPDR